MKPPVNLSRGAGALCILFGLSSCAGATAQVKAERARYPLSLSSVVRQQDGVLLQERSLEKLARLNVSSNAVAIGYSHLPKGEVDISEEVNKQVRKAGGEAVINLTISAGGGCGFFNAFPFLNLLPFWPGCVPVSVTGDIVKRRRP